MKTGTLVGFLVILAFGISCQNQNPKNKNIEMNTADSTSGLPAGIKTDSIDFTVNGKNYLGYVAYDAGIEGQRPGILVIPEWWGLNDYTKGRARQLAELGYIAMAVDMYGDGRIAPDPQTAQELASVYYKDPSLTRTQIDAALEKLKSFSQTDTSKIGAIGYCFGGFVVLNAAKLGANLEGVVSFHGSLTGVKPDKKLLKAKILVCHGGADEFENPHVAEFKKEMDSAGISYTFNVYPGASHAFSNPEATAKGEKFHMPIRYNEAADTASWNDMKMFFKGIF